MQDSPVADFSSSMPMTVRRGDVFLSAQSTGPVWRVLKGAFRVDCQTESGERLVHLALTGDWVGVEALCEEPYAYSVTALVDSEVQCEAMVDLPPIETMAAVLRQQQRQMLEMVPLRSGSVVSRLTHLLGLLARCCNAEMASLTRKDMPRLKQTAQLIDTAVETVCREMGRLLPDRATRAPVALKLVASRQASPRPAKLAA